MVAATNSKARTLIAAHGAEAITYAEYEAMHVRILHMRDEAEEWERVIVAIKTIQGSRTAGA
jgi:hypothetical protein